LLGRENVQSSRFGMMCLGIAFGCKHLMVAKNDRSMFVLSIGASRNRMSMGKEFGELTCHYWQE
jgi:hypothetical protein